MEKKLDCNKDNIILYRNIFSFSLIRDQFHLKLFKSSHNTVAMLQCTTFTAFSTVVVPLSNTRFIPSKVSRCKRSPQRRCRIPLPRAQLGENNANDDQVDDDDDADGDDMDDDADQEDEEFDILTTASLRREGLDPSDRLSTFFSASTEALNRPENPVARDILQSRTALSFLVTSLPGQLYGSTEEYLSSSARLIVASSLSILFGFFGSTSATTIIGSVADWDPLAALVLLIITEGFTKWYYKSDTRKSSRVVQLINAFKIGLIFGMTVDAFKLST